MLTLQGSGLVGVPGSAAKLFMALSEQQINIILISQGSSENSISYVISAEQSEVATLAQEKARKEVENYFSQNLIHSFRNYPELIVNIVIVVQILKMGNL